jgi:hypothetical protein
VTAEDGPPEQVLDDPQTAECQPLLRRFLSEGAKTPPEEPLRRATPLGWETFGSSLHGHGGGG